MKGKISNGIKGLVIIFPEKASIPGFLLTKLCWLGFSQF